MEYKILGPILIPDLVMGRYHEEIGFYEAAFPAEVIAHYREKFHREGKEGNFDLSHSNEMYSGARMTDSFLITNDNRQSLPEAFQDLPSGTWMIEMTFDNIEEYNKIVELGLTGFSIEGTFTMVGENGDKITIKDKFRIMNKLSDILPFNIYVFGGSTGGAGRNEHGDAHFQLKEKTTRKDLGKIFMPKLDVWRSALQDEKMNMMVVHSGPELSNRDKKAIVRWLDMNENENLIKCQNQWNESNKDNNRTNPI